MKKLLTGLLTISSIGLLMLASCKKSDKLVTDSGSTASTLTASTTAPVLNPAMLTDTNTIIMFNLTTPKYTYKGAGQTNQIQVDPVGDNWKNPSSAVLTSTTEGFNTFALAKLLISLNLTAGKQTQVNVRVANQLSAESALYSNVVTLTVTPINLASYIYAPGDYQGWNNDASGIGMDSLESATSNSIYSGIIDFAPGGTYQFKLIPVKGDWSNSWGTFDTSPTNTTIVYDGSNDNNLYAPGPGGYLVTANTILNTITYTPQWSVIGDASPGGWNTDTNMLFNASNNTWYITVKLVSDGTNAIKFRFNNAWTVNLGGSGGTLTSGGSNITIPSTGAAGLTYKITLDPVADTYTIVQQ